MTLWWLSFRDGSAVIIEAESLAHARLLAVANDLGRASYLVIPEDFVGRKLFANEAGELLGLLKRGPPRRSARPILQSGPHAVAG
jgi:hypothetical protein